MNVTISNDTRKTPKKGAKAKNTNNQGQQRPPKVSPPGQGQSKSARRRRARAARQDLGPSGSRSGVNSANAFRGNRYLNALMDPKSGTGTRIPDIDCQLTGTFQINQDLTVSTQAGDASAIAWYPRVLKSAYYTASNIAVSGNLTWSGANDMASATSVISLYDSIRLVSASIEAEYMGTTSSDNGIVIGGCVPALGINWSAANNLTTFYTVPSFSYFPLRNGMKVIYKPTDNTDFEYKSVQGTPDTISNADGLFPPMLVIGVDGAQSNAKLLKVRLCANFEGVPKSNVTDLVQSDYSIANSGWLDHAMNVLSPVPSAMAYIPDTLRTIGSAFGAYNGIRQALRNR